MSGCLSLNAFIPSGADNKHMKIMDFAPRFFSISTASIAEPPVASIGSTTNNKRSSISFGILQKYSTGSNVFSSRYRPI